MRRPAGPDDDAGSVLLLTIFLGLLLVVATAVVVDASAAFLARRSLAGQADGAALRAAQSLDYAAFYAGDGDVLPLGDVEAAAATYVGTAAPGVTLAGVDSDGATVTVRLARPLRLPFAPPGYPREVTVTAEATARLVRR